MPIWNLAELSSHATTALGNRSDLAASTVSFWVNMAGRTVWDSLPHAQQEKIATSSTTVNEDKLSLPSDFEEVLALSNLSSTADQPSLLDLINLDQAEAYSTQSGLPKHYIQYADWLELRPVPDSAYSLQLRYRAQWSDMTTTSDHPSVATRLRYGIFLKSVELLARHVTQDDAKASWAHNEYVGFMTQMPSDRALQARELHTAGLSLGRTRGAKATGSSYSFDRDVD